ncbi:hypothetical protein POM88_016018 [Heracleum sosnowskyi]|uniref:Uncharacterized protein n=1 Tax=Heracleum sosnowskyi TaxID=360622 RepID=A0AAD8MSJ8_9APIA|nr:hypothetical protein POM88_016018 [Heracleum sosnowskyi]
MGGIEEQLQEFVDWSQVYGKTEDPKYQWMHALSANEEVIDIYLPMRDIPSWFRHQLSNSSRISLDMPKTVPNRVIGMILWFNVGHPTSPRKMQYSDNIAHAEFGALTCLNFFMGYSGKMYRDVCDEIIKYKKESDASDLSASRDSDVCDFWASVCVNRMTHTRGWFCETSAWKPVPQSWVSFIPHAQFPLKAGEQINVHVKDYTILESIGGHLMYA